MLKAGRNFYPSFMQKLKNHTLKEYLDRLSTREPIPGGGSAAALVAALGASLLSMATNYSISPKKTKTHNIKMKKSLVKSEKIRKRLLELVDLDAKAYLAIVKTKHKSAKIKNAALKKGRKVPLEVCRLCYAAVELAPMLIKEGNHHLASDVKAGVEMLEAAFNGAITMVKANR